MATHEISLGDFVLLDRREQQIGLERRGQHFAQVVDRFGDPQDMVVHVAKIGVGIAVDQRNVEAHQAGGHVGQRHDASSQGDQVGLEVIDALDAAAVEGVLEDALLERFDLELERVDHRGVVVDDEVDQRVEDEILALAQQVGRAFAAQSHVGIG